MRRCRRPSGPAGSQVPSGGRGAGHIKISCLYISMCAAIRVSGGIRLWSRRARTAGAAGGAARIERGRSMSDALVDRAIHARREWGGAFGRQRRQVRAVPRLLADRGLPGRSLGASAGSKILRMATGACQRRRARRGQGKGGQKAVARGSYGPCGHGLGAGSVRAGESGARDGPPAERAANCPPRRAASPHSIQGWDAEQCAAGGPIRPEMQGRKPSLCALRLRPLTDRPPSF